MSLWSTGETLQSQILQLVVRQVALVGHVPLAVAVVLNRRLQVARNQLQAFDGIFFLGDEVFFAEQVGDDAGTDRAVLARPRRAGDACRPLWSGRPALQLG